MLEALKSELDRYRDSYRNPNLKRLMPSEIYAFFPDDQVEDLATRRWPEEWPNNGCSGVYLVYDKSKALLYVGKSYFLGGRLSKYFQYESPHGQGKCNVVDDWGEKRPMYVVTVPVPADSRFEAAGLEEYLIERLRPLTNRRGLREL